MEFGYVPRLRFNSSDLVGVKVLNGEEDRRKRSCIGFEWTLSCVRGVLPAGARLQTYTAPWRRGFRPRKPKPVKQDTQKSLRAAPLDRPIRPTVVKQRAPTCVRYAVPVDGGCVYAEAHKLRRFQFNPETGLREVAKWARSRGFKWEVSLTKGDDSKEIHYKYGE